MPNDIDCPHTLWERVLDGVQNLFLCESERAIVRIHGCCEQEDDLVLLLGIGIAVVARDTVDAADAAATPVRQSPTTSLSLITTRTRRSWGGRVVSVEAVVEMFDAVHDVPERERQDFDPAIGILATVVFCDHVLRHIPVVDKDDAAIAVQEWCTGLDLGEVIVAWSRKKIIKSTRKRL